MEVDLNFDFKLQMHPLYSNFNIIVLVRNAFNFDFFKEAPLKRQSGAI
jgi:hypothetical protein